MSPRSIELLYNRYAVLYTLVKLAYRVNPSEIDALPQDTRYDLQQHSVATSVRSGRTLTVLLYTRTRAPSQASQMP